MPMIPARSRIKLLKKGGAASAAAIKSASRGACSQARRLIATAERAKASYMAGGGYASGRALLDAEIVSARRALRKCSSKKRRK